MSIDKQYDFLEKDPDAGKDWRQEEKGTTEDEMVGWHHQLDGHEFEQALVVGDGQGSLMCCSMGLQRVGHDWATELNWTEVIQAARDNTYKLIYGPAKNNHFNSDFSNPKIWVLLIILGLKLFSFLFKSNISGRCHVELETTLLDYGSKCENPPMVAMSFLCIILFVFLSLFYIWKLQLFFFFFVYWEYFQCMIFSFFVLLSESFSKNYEMVIQERYPDIQISTSSGSTCFQGSQANDL